MRQQTAVAPTGVERSFDADEIIVTKTDLRGHITYANDVFLRVSAFVEDDVIGEPHSLIRHPDMPRAVFSLLWETLKSGNEIFAYVVNLAGDGAHYWVLAHVTPSFDASGAIVGYHSNRRVPSRSALDRIQPLYREIVAAERRHSSAREAAAAGRAHLDDVLAQQQMTYDELIWHLAGSEKW